MSICKLTAYTARCKKPPPPPTLDPALINPQKSSGADEILALSKPDELQLLLENSSGSGSGLGVIARPELCHMRGR